MLYISWNISKMYQRVIAEFCWMSSFGEKLNNFSMKFALCPPCRRFIAINGEWS